MGKIYRRKRKGKRKGNGCIACGGIQPYCNCHNKLVCECNPYHGCYCKPTYIPSIDYFPHLSMIFSRGSMPTNLSEVFARTNHIITQIRI